MEAEGGGVTPFWAETNQDFRRHRGHSRRNIRIPNGVFAVLLSPLALIPTLVVAAVLVFYIPTLLAPLSQFLRRVPLFNSWEAFNLLLVLFAILTGIFSRNTSAGGHQPHHQESDPFAAKLFDFPGKSEDRNGHDEVGGSRIIFQRSDPLRNEETHPAAVQEEAPLSQDLKAAWFPDDGRKTERFGSQGNLISADAHFQRDADFGECSLGSSSSSSAHSPPKASNVDHGSLIRRRRSPTSFPHAPPPLENIETEDGFVVPSRRSPPPLLLPSGSINVDGSSSIRRKHFPPSLLSHSPEAINADDGADVERKHSRPPLVYPPLETMNSDDGYVMQRKHSSPPLKSLSPPPLPHSAYPHAPETLESKTKRRSKHKSKDAPSSLTAPSSSRKKEKNKKKKEKEKEEKEKKKSRGPEPTAEILVPPSLPPPPPSSFFHQWFADMKNESKMEKLRPHSDRLLPPLPPPSSLPPHLGTTKKASSSTERPENARKDNVGSRDSSIPRPALPSLIKEKQNLQIEARSSSSDSSSGRSIPYLPPPPPPPFAVPEESTVKQSKAVQTRRESRRVYEGLTEQRRSEERSGNSFCPSPDVNVKADKFIAQFHEGIRLEKLQFAKEKLVREGVGSKR
ncbi:verprolin-like [Nymphaea colorata]|uniref:verprolin-like n=1 Tax=Nymphaea colorata TaxID=210225 RepID=UPI00129D61FB|nr:verprolin-like [Nymphaea colorata]